MLIILAWGDADALAEAGFCYAQGVGCKKDLKKSAKFYRQAEAKGTGAKTKDIQKVSSETHRGSPEKEKDKKPRNKSRTRTMFRRRKDTT
jgi:TPR repeat protein